MSEGVEYVVPEEQKIRYRVEPLEGALLSLSLVGRQMSALSDLITVCCEKDEPGVKWQCLIQNIQTDDKGAVEFTVVVCPKAPTQDQG